MVSSTNIKTKILLQFLNFVLQKLIQQKILNSVARFSERAKASIVLQAP